MTERECELIEHLTDTLERMHLDEYLEYIANRRRILWNHLLYGLARGLGFTLGFAVLGALAVAILRHLVLQNIPIISDFFAEVIHAIEAKM